jgi:ankyrin repeat protein
VQPLLFVVQSGNLELVGLLLGYGADINVECSERPNDGTRKVDRALFLAAEKSDEAVVNLLLERGADPEVTDMFGQPPLTYAFIRKLLFFFGK